MRAMPRPIDLRGAIARIGEATARVISREPVVYVRNILKYYVTYRLFQERRAARGE
jgi:hypothetical protein